MLCFFSASSCSHKISASVVFSSLPLCQLYLMDHSHALLCYFEKKKRGRGVSWVGEFPYRQRKMYFCFSLPQTNTPLGLALGLEGIWEWHETKQQQQPLKQVWTFLEDCLACRYAWMGVTEWEWRHLIYSQALKPAGQQQQGHYGQTPASQSCATGSSLEVEGRMCMFVWRWR